MGKDFDCYNQKNMACKMMANDMNRCGKSMGREFSACAKEVLKAQKVERWADIEQGDMFLGKNGLVIENLKPNDNGDIELTLPEYAYNYSCMEILVSNMDSFCQKTVQLNQDQTKWKSS